MVGLSEALFYLAKGCGLLYSSARKTLLALSKQPARFDHVAAYHACMTMTLHKDAFVCRL